MISESFIFLDRISYAKEQQLWAYGIKSWSDFLAANEIPGISKERKLFYNRQLLQAKYLLEKKELSQLAKLFPQREHWRLYALFKHQAMALDIETSQYYGDITVIGLHDGQSPYFLVKNKNLSHEPLVELLAEPKVLLTFNGSSFDLPIIRRRFPQVDWSPHLHIDLRHVAARVGLSGGLKHIESVLGLSRSEEIQNMAGDNAILLWEQHLMGDERALELLIAYNEADVENLFPLAEYLIKELWRTIYK